MSPVALLSTLHRAGVEVSLHLRIVGPPEALTDRLRSALAENKPALLSHLAGLEQGSGETPPRAPSKTPESPRGPTDKTDKGPSEPLLSVLSVPPRDESPNFEPPDPEAVRRNWEARGLRETAPGVYSAPGFETWKF